MIEESSLFDLLVEKKAKIKKLNAEEYPVNMDLPKGVKVFKKIGAEYWYVRRGAVTLGVVSRDNEGKFDADLDPSGAEEGDYKKGFPSVEAAVTWILAKEGIL